MADKKTLRKSLVTGVGTFSFPHVFKETVSENDKGEDVYEVQIIIPKTDRKAIKALIDATREVAEDKWGKNWAKARPLLRDGDEEADELTEDGSTKGEKYPERLGCMFFTARSKRPVGVVDRDRVLINEPDDVYGGCKGRLSITLYPYVNSGNMGVAAGLDGVQKTGDGEPLGTPRPSVESMFSDDVDDLDDAEDVKPTKAKNKVKAKAKDEKPAKGKKSKKG